MTGALNRGGQLSLMFGAESGLSPRPYLAAAKRIPTQQLGLLVVDTHLCVCAESTESRTLPPPSILHFV